MAIIDQIMREYGLRSAARQAPQFAPLNPEEESGILDSLAGGGLRGLAYVGSSLDKALGGRALRGFLGGKNQELASIIPFSDTLGITNEANQVSGRDLAEQWGMVGPNQEGFDWGDVGGMAVETALDPGTYLSFGAGALSKAGLAAEKAGTLGKTVAERIAAGQGGHMGIGLPFMGNAATFDLRPLGRASAAIGGALASPITAPAKAIGGYLNNLTEGALGETLSGAGRSLRSLFDTSVGEEISKEGQAIAPQILEQRDVYDVANRKELAGIGRLIGLPGAEGQELRYLVEERGLRQAGDPDALAAWAAASPEMRLAADRVSQLQAAKLNEAESIGRRTRGLQSLHGTEHFPRQLTQVSDEEIDFFGPRAGSPMDPEIDYDMQRQAILDVPGGTRKLNKLATNPRLSTRARTVTDPALVAKELRDIHGVVNPEYVKLTKLAEAAAGGMGPVQSPKSLAETVLEKQATGAKLADEELEILDLFRTETADPYAKARKLADYFGTLSPERLPVAAGGKGKGFMGRSSLADLETYDVQHAKAMSAAEIGQQTLAAAAKANPADAGPGARKVRDVINSMGLTVNKLATAQQAAVGNVLDHYVSAELAESLVDGARAFTVPDQARGIVKLVRDFTDFFKKGVTTPFPAFHGRNIASAGWMNMTLGVKPWSSAYREARRILRGEGLSATDIKLADEAFAHRITGANYLDRSNVATETGKDILRRIPGALPNKGVASTVVEAGKAGFQKKLGAVQAPLEAGRQLGNEIEDTMRLAAYLDLRKRGFAEDVAAAKVRAAHVDYNKLTAFERKFMRPLIPFYTFARHNIPHQLKQIMDQPGGLTAQAIKGSANLREAAGEGFVPEYLGQGAAVPVGEEEDGTQRFLTQLGLPFEQPFDVLDPSSAARTGERLLSQLNPLVKAPLEYISNKQFFSGRELDKLYSPTGNITFDQIMANLPTARLQSTARTIADERKGPAAKLLNLLTGVKVSDVDMEKQRDIAARQLLGDVLGDTAGVRSFEKFYVPESEMANLDPQTVALMRLLRTQEKRAREEAKKRQPAAVR